MSAYYLPTAYKENTATKQYVDHDDGVIWQCGAYDLAFSLMSEVRSVIDIGCGGARKLRRFAALGIPVIGYDANHPKEEAWIDQRSIDLDHDNATDFLKGADLPALVICADVIEHLQHPLWLLGRLIDLALDGNIVIVTTPDRELSHGENHMGPPPNLAHVREWNMCELVDLIHDLVPETQKHRLLIDDRLTQTSNKSDAKQTITITMRRK